MKNKIILAAELVLILALAVGSASAFGVSSPYWSDNPLKMVTGQVAVVNLNLQNMVGDEDVTVTAKVVEGADIASINNNKYTVKAGTHDTNVPVTIEAPADSTETRRVKIEFRTINEDNKDGAVMVGTGFATAFDVLVSEGQAEELNESVFKTYSLMPVMLAVVLLIIGIAAAYRFRKKK